MREIKSSKITETVARLCTQANFLLPEDVLRAAGEAYRKEKSDTAKEILGQIVENAKLAGTKGIPLCQDTGITDIFLKIGQEVEITGGTLAEAVNKGAAEGYKKGYLRKSVVSDPLERKNTGDNTPANIYSEIVPGNKIEITVLPKGAGSENASALKMLPPSAGWEGIKEFILQTAKAAVNACPPIIVGVGIGGSFSSVAGIAKKALLRKIGEPNTNTDYAKKENELLKEINETGIGPMGLGGNTTAFAVHIEAAPCHIASLPVAVSIQCHSCRRMTEII
ncbi:MAG: fumarate hydratase [Elusimicrobiota bacterium]